MDRTLDEIIAERPVCPNSSAPTNDDKLTAQQQRQSQNQNRGGRRPQGRRRDGVKKVLPPFSLHRGLALTCRVSGIGPPSCSLFELSSSSTSISTSSYSPRTVKQNKKRNSKKQLQSLASPVVSIDATATPRGTAE